MKTYRQLISEVARPKSGDEKHFVDKHEIEILDHPESEESQHTSDAEQIKRLADYVDGEDEEVYESDGGSFTTKNVATWKANAKSRGLTVRDSVHPDTGEQGTYLTAKDKQGNHRGHFDMSSKSGVLGESADSKAAQFKVGALSLDDGSTVTIKKQDADALNAVLGGLNSANRAQMVKVAMRSRSGFSEILGFAREAQ
jgi:hypothetical protein